MFSTATIAANPTLQHLRDAVRKQACSLVFAGGIARAEGRDSAVAGECVRARLQQARRYGKIAECTKLATRSSRRLCQGSGTRLLVM